MAQSSSNEDTTTNVIQTGGVNYHGRLHQRRSTIDSSASLHTDLDGSDLPGAPPSSHVPMGKSFSGPPALTQPGVDYNLDGSNAIF